MYFIIGFCVILLGINIIVYFIASLIRGYRSYKKAKLLEQNKDYKLACWNYGVVIRYGWLIGMRVNKEIKIRIKYLWDKYGPFDYSDVKDKMEKDSCGAAAADTEIATIIEKIAVQNNNNLIEDKE